MRFSYRYNYRLFDIKGLRFPWSPQTKSFATESWVSQNTCKGVKKGVENDSVNLGSDQILWPFFIYDSQALLECRDNKKSLHCRNISVEQQHIRVQTTIRQVRPHPRRQYTVPSSPPLCMAGSRSQTRIYKDLGRNKASGINHQKHV